MLFLFVGLLCSCLAASPRSCARPVFKDTHNNGAYYHKLVASPSTRYVGIGGVVTLGKPSFDMTRFRPAKFFVGNYDSQAKTPRDRPSLYLGGFSTYECDVGLTWDRVFRSDGLPVYTDAADGNSEGDAANEFFVEKDGSGEPVLWRRSDRSEVARGRENVQSKVAELMPAMAYRPYWRAFNSENGNWWGTEKPTSPTNYYFYPGQTIQMELKVVGFQQMNLKISGTWNNQDYTFSKTFEQLKWSPGARIIWKRVNSIDQEGTECRGISRRINGVFIDKLGKECGVQKTQTTVKGANWSRAYLLDANLNKVPFACGLTIERGMDIVPSYNRIFLFTHVNPESGASIVDILPKNAQ